MIRIQVFKAILLSSFLAAVAEEPGCELVPLTPEQEKTFPQKVLGFVVCLVLVLISVSVSYLMYAKKAKAGKVAAKPRDNGEEKTDQSGG
ncbi:MAG: hypothetical protein PHH49_04820 [Candidatus Omnitrophica bacterium]|nr:hypothetical protein [Candidatus Omnitrophota bacterium]MDD5488268.1 hypothetical protein [Candidatus Omnitrophota bacterium]